MTRDEFSNLAAKGFLLDGATGSNLIAAGKTRDMLTEDWLLTHPQPLIDLQRGYAEAGSQMVYAPSFTASGAYHESDVAELNHRMVALSRSAVPGLYVAGDLTTVGSADFDLSRMYEIYTEQVKALLEAGVDALVIETMMGLDEAIAAVESARNLCDLPILCSFSVMPGGSFYFGGDLFEAADTLSAFGLDAIGINCSSGPENLLPTITRLRAETDLPIIAKPNAGMPEIDERGRAVYSLGPEAFAAAMKPLLDAGASVVGGCCGTTPAHIAALKAVMRQ